MIPKPLLLAMLALVLASLAVVSFSVLTGRDHVGVPKSATIVAERSIILKGGGAQAVTVLATDGTLLMDLPHGGFITVIQNGHGTRPPDRGRRQTDAGAYCGICEWPPDGARRLHRMERRTRRLRV